MTKPLTGPMVVVMATVWLVPVQAHHHAAEPANRDAQCRAGRDDIEAVRWYRLATENDDAEAQYELGRMYAKMRSMERNEQDDIEAVRWYRAAAEQGYAFAQSSLAFMYAVGRGVEQDGAEAQRWYRLAAEQGNARAQLILRFSEAWGR